MEMIGFSGLTIMILECKEKNKRIVIYTSLATESEDRTVLAYTANSCLQKSIFTVLQRYLLPLNTLQ